MDVARAWNKVIAHRRRVGAGILAVVLIVSGTFGYRLTTKAEVAMFYPTVCLGGWQYPDHATGKPDADTSFTVSNSALLQDAQSQIFCSGFEGELPENVQQDRVLVRFSWGQKGDEPTATTTTIIVDDFIESAVEDVINLAPDDPGEVTIPDSSGGGGSSQNPEPVPVVPPETAPDASPETPEEPESSPEVPSEPEPELEPEREPAPEPEPEPEPQPSEPVSFWRNLIPVAIAQETEVVEATPENIEVVVEEIQEPVVDEELPGESVSDESVSDGETLDETQEAAPILEVLYTLDGTDWRSLGTVSSLSDQSAFEIPVSEVSTPEDLARVQIAVHALPSVNALADIYLDAMWIEVEYSNPADDPFPPPNPARGDVILEEIVYEEKVAVLVARPSDTGTTTELWLRDNVTMPYQVALVDPVEVQAEAEVIEDGAVKIPVIEGVAIDESVTEDSSQPEEEEVITVGEEIQKLPVDDGEADLGSSTPVSAPIEIIAVGESPNWVRIAGDELLGDKPGVQFDYGNVFWVGEGDTTAWRYIVSTGSYESISVSGGEIPKLHFTDEGGEPKALFFGSKSNPIRIEDDTSVIEDAYEGVAQ